MKLNRATGLLVALILSLPVMAAETSTISAKDIMQKVSTAERGDNMSTEVAMTILDEKGNKRESNLKVYSKEFGGNNDETRTVMFFVFPHTYKNIGFLTIDFDDAAKEDKRWIYVPTTHKTKQIEAKDKRGAFMNSDFSYADLSVQRVDNCNFKLIKEDVVDGQKVWVIEGTPQASEEMDDNGYAKSVYTVRQDDFMLIKAIHALQDGNRVKTLNVVKAEKIEGHWVPTEVSMETQRNGRFISKTTMLMTNTKFDNHFDSNFFDVGQLTRGPN
jgi:hypothetical protein